VFEKKSKFIRELVKKNWSKIGQQIGKKIGQNIVQKH